MPELPDIELYLHALRSRVLRRELEGIRRQSHFFLRTADPPIAEAAGKTVRGLQRLGKRIVMTLDQEHHLVIHLMIAGRFRWTDAPDAPIQAKTGLAAFDFPNGTLIVTEAGTKKSASLHFVQGAEALSAHDPGGIEPLDIDRAEFENCLSQRNHTLKRALTDPRLLAGIGNAYSDEILFEARLSPVAMTAKLADTEWTRLFEATQQVLRSWRDKLIAETGDGWPRKVTAFRREMTVHGRYEKPCRKCQTPIQRIRHATNEINYCPRCQTDGRLLADRALSRLLKQDWPRTIDELERLRS